MCLRELELASGGVIGRDHRLGHRNYQDSLHVTSSEQSLVTVVTDGCGSSPHSEVGAQVGARLLGELVQTQVQNQTCGVQAVKWQRVLQHLLATIDGLARQMGGNYRKVIEEYFLFTFLGVAIDEETATFFGLGDGVIIVNGTALETGPYPSNMPPYAAYGLLGNDIDINPALITIRTHIVPTTQLEHFLIGTDGVEDLMAAAEKHVPGTTDIVGGVNQFWESDRYYGRNSELISRRLRLLGRDWPKRNPDPGLLPDDTSLIVGRRRLTA